MKDLNELESDASSRKTATDWLMHVISGKKPTTLTGNGGALNGNGPGSGSHAAAVAESPREEDIKRPVEVAPEFTAEDLCGAPVVPVIKVTPRAKDEITADDVCWVPVERRLKPQTDVAVETFGPRLRIVQPPAREPRVEVIEEPELPKRETPNAETPLPDIWRDSFRARDTQEAPITAADISRDPTLYPAEPTWGGVASHNHREVFEPEADVITAADISRGGPREQLPELGIIDLPSSFRVIRSARPPIEAAAPVVEAAAPVIEVPSPLIEAAVPVVEASPESVVEVGGGAAEVAGAAEQQIETARPEEGSVVGESVDSGIPAEGTAVEQISAEAVVEESAAAAEAAVVPEPNETDLQEMEAALAENEAAPVEVAGEPEVEAKPEVVVEADPAIVAEPEVAAEAATEAGAEAEVKTAENVFARQGFWEGTAGEAAASEENMSPKSLLRGLKRAYATPEHAAESENRPEGWVSAWKTLLRLGAVLPWLTRALPALEAGAMGEPVPAAAPGVAQEIRQDVAGLRLVQYEIRTTVQDHSMQLKRIEEQLARVRESMESQASASADLAESVRSMTKLVRLAAMGLSALMVVLILLVAAMVVHH